MHLPSEIQTRIIKQATLLELVEYFQFRLNKQKLMFSLLINSHCCCCGKTLPFFHEYKPNIINVNYYGSSRQYFYVQDRLSETNNLHYEGKFCSKRCWRRLDDYEQDDMFPPLQQVRSGSDGIGFFENLNKKYNNVWNRDTDIGLRLNI